ncbi:MAG: tetratricopeptide repeat protein [Myxococcales bacterium]|nr:tetratricopeptide repeat protein [Myxococcales bacterium]
MSGDSFGAAEFSPAELDLLEDALEGCDAPDFDPARALPDDAPSSVRARLEEYRELLALGREALPMVDVPVGALDDVIAEALSSGSSVSPAPEKPGVGFWTRLRRSFVLPGVVLAGTAAALLVIMQPPADEAPAVSTVTAKAEAQQVAQLDAVEARVEEEAAADEDAPPPPSAAAPAPMPEAAAAGDAGGAYAAEDAKPTRAKKSEASASKGYAGAELDDALEPEPEEAKDKFDAAALIEKADTLRQRGRCSQAMELYEQATGATGIHQARAFAGLGLCAEYDGDSKSAFRYFNQAREAAPSIDSWIASQEGLTGSMVKSKRKAAPKASKPSSKQSKKVLLEDAFE